MKSLEAGLLGRCAANRVIRRGGVGPLWREGHSRAARVAALRATGDRGLGWIGFGAEDAVDAGGFGRGVGLAQQSDRCHT